MTSATQTLCTDCSALLDASALSCPSCHCITHAAELESLSVQARQAFSRGDLPAARNLWEQASLLLPPETVQFRAIRAHIESIDASIAAAPKKPHAKWGKGAAAVLGPILLILGKFKFIVLGLTKLSTFLSMLAFAGVYWALYGWAFALGIVFSIYIHEMGHVLALRGFGIPASAPMFIPGFGAFIRLKSLHITPIQDARVGLAGPIYGLGAAVVALVIAYATGSKIWGAIAHFGAFINLFNLIPVWQLDGSRGLRSLTRRQRIMILAATLVLLLLSSERMLFLIALVTGYRLFTKDASPVPDRLGLLQFLGLLAALTVVAHFAQVFAR